MGGKRKREQTLVEHDDTPLDLLDPASMHNVVDVGRKRKASADDAYALCALESPSIHVLFCCLCL